MASESLQELFAVGTEVLNRASENPSGYAALLLSEVCTEVLAPTSVECLDVFAAMHRNQTGLRVEVVVGKDAARVSRSEVHNSLEHFMAAVAELNAVAAKVVTMLKPALAVGRVVELKPSNLPSS